MLFDAHGRPVQGNFSDSTRENAQREVATHSVKDQATHEGNKPPPRSISDDSVINSQRKQAESYEEKNYRLRKGALSFNRSCACSPLSRVWRCCLLCPYRPTAKRRLCSGQLEATDTPWVKIAGIESM